MAQPTQQSAHQPTHQSLKKPTKTSSSSLGKHIFWILLVKVVVLTGLWHAFIKPNKVRVQPADVEHLYRNDAAPALKKPNPAP